MRVSTAGLGPPESVARRSIPRFPQSARRHTPHCAHARRCVVAYRTTTTTGTGTGTDTGTGAGRWGGGPRWSTPVAVPAGGGGPRWSTGIGGEPAPAPAPVPLL